MPVAAGEKVRASVLNRLQPKPYYAVATTTLPASSSSVLVPGLSITLTTETAGAAFKAWIVLDADPAGAATTLISGRLLVDAVGQPVFATYAGEVSTDRSTVPQNYKGTLASAGSHTFTVVATTNANQQINVYSSLLVEITEVV